jgi:2-keto-4-pentenoate hydratase
MRSDPRVVAGMERQLAARLERLDAGEKHVGWKVGLNAPALMEHLGLDAFVVGYMASGTRLESGQAMSLTGATNAAAEPEVAIRVGHDLGITAVGPAIEVVDIDRGFDDLETIIATDIFHAGVLLGAEVAQPGDVAGGTLHSTAGEQAIETPSPDELAVTLRTVSERLEEAGEELRPGDVVIAGALLPAVPVAPGDRVELDLGALGRLELAFS